MTTPIRFPYIDSDLRHPGVSLLPYLPLTLTYGATTVQVSGLVDSGATINVLPYPIGTQLGLLWEHHTTSIQLTGNMAQAPARAVVLTAAIAGWAPVRLAFAWTQLEVVPLILGQVNFFLEFDVCFFRTQARFEVQPKANR